MQEYVRWTGTRDRRIWSLDGASRMREDSDIEASLAATSARVPPQSRPSRRRPAIDFPRRGNLHTIVFAKSHSRTVIY